MSIATVALTGTQTEIVGRKASFTPQASMQETDARFVLRMPVANIDPMRLGVALENNVLTVSGTDKTGFQPFRRTFAFPTPVTENGLDMHLNDRELTIIVNKQEVFTNQL